MQVGHILSDYYKEMINFANDLFEPQLMQVGHVVSEYY